MSKRHKHHADRKPGEASRQKVVSGGSGQTAGQPNRTGAAVQNSQGARADQGPGLAIARVLLTVAAMAATYLAYVSLSNGPVAGCGSGSGCDKVLQSRWAYWFGIPSSLPAVAVYLGLIVATMFAQSRAAAPEIRRRAWMLTVALSVVIAGAALWFVGLQAFVIKAFCKFCMTAHLCGLAGAIACLRSTPVGTHTDASRPQQPTSLRLPRPAFLQFAVLGLAGIGVLIAGQLLVEKKRNVVKAIPLLSATNISIQLPSAGNPPAPPTTPTNLTQPTATAAPPATTPTTSIAATAATSPHTQSSPPPSAAGSPRLFPLYGGEFVLNLNEVPMIGPSNAPHIVVSLFDYTCHHCRALHPMLREAQRRYSNELGIVSLPMPMSTNCNPAILRNFRAHLLACDYARLGLAVWRVDRDAFHRFDDWLFEPEHPVPPEQAKQFATDLVGAVRLESALNDPWITSLIHTNGRLYHTNYLKVGNSQMPELMIGSSINFGPLPSTDELVKLLRQHLGLK